MKKTTLGIGLSAVCACCVPLSASAVRPDAGFLRQTNAAMQTMMNAMVVAPSGNVDRDFVATMVPHHQGAIDMARAELRFGHNVVLRRISAEIIVTQQEEIVAMRRALAGPGPAGVGK